MAFTKKDMQSLLSTQTKELKGYADKQTESLARIIAKAFEQERQNTDKRFNEIIRMLDVRKDVDELKSKMRKVFEALNI